MMNLSNTKEPIIDIKDLRYSYGKNPVLNIRSLKIYSGEKIFIYGPSGSGKTTLLGLLAGVIPPQEGSIKVLGQDLGRMSAANRDSFRGNHLGYIFQMFNLIPYLSVQDNILLAADLNQKRKAKLTSNNREQAVLSLATDLGIETLLKRNVTALSVGQQQRVAAARALVGAPEIIIADEPTSALDYDHREKFLQLLFRECEKTKASVVFVSHDRQLEKLFDRCISLQEINTL